MNQNHNSNLWLSMIALAGQDAPEGDDIVEALRRDWPEWDEVAVSQSHRRLTTITMGDAVAAATHISTPIPWEQLEGPCEVAWYWPQAAAAMRSHDSHLLVTLLDEGRHALDKSLRLTQITAAVAETAAAPAGVFWGPGRLVHNAADFVQAAQAMSPDHLPLFLWIDFRVVQQPDQGLSLFTTGMEPFGFRELEVRDFAGSWQTLIESAFNVAHYMLEQKSSVQEGHTIGLPDGTQLTARFEASMCDPAQEVMRLKFHSPVTKDASP